MSLIPLLLSLSFIILCSSCQRENWSTHKIQCAENGKYVFSEFPSNWGNASNVSIYLQCETVVLTKQFNISNITNLYIKGTNRIMSKLSCSNTSSNIVISNINTLIIENIVVESCGGSHIYDSALSIKSCNNITVRNTTISNSSRSGMLVKAKSGTVTIENCFFEYNQIRGLKVWHSTEQFVQITNCEFTRNLKGGMVIYLNKNKSTTVIKNSTFSFNKATIGGGVKIKYYPFRNNPVSNIIFEDCIFENNTAVEGGGTLIESNLGLLYEYSNNLSFKSCVWQNNSQAVSLENINPIKKFHFMPEFVNCNFTQNGNASTLDGYVFQVINSRAKFRGITIFANNSKSAIKAVSSDLVFEQNSVNKFIGNEAKKGAALHLIGNTTMWLNGSQSFKFRQNKAKKNGGAIYVEPYKYLLPGLEPSCFIRSMHPNFTINVTFEGNSAKTDDIYTVSLLPCLEDVGSEQLWNKEFIAKSRISTAAFTFINSDTNYRLCPFRLNTSVLIVNTTLTSPTEVTMEMHAIPGKTRTLQLQLVDEFCNEVSFNDYYATEYLTNTKNSTIIQFNKEEIKITMSGRPGVKDKIKISANNHKNLESPLNAYIDVIMDYCPPGFMLDDKKECTCGSSSKTQFFGIKDCNLLQFQAYVKRGYWVGYYPSKNHTHKTFASSVCPEGFCQSCSSGNSTCKMYLPSNSSEDTSPYVCSDNRKGTRCGTCTNNHSAYYHTKIFSCKKNKYCHLGWLYYILSEIIPVTIFFLLIIFFNISFTSGSLNGVILSMQLINTMKINAENLIEFDKHIEDISNIYRFFYQIFTLSFDENLFPFCLFEGASALDMLAFRYVTIVYSLFLVIATIFLLKLCSLNPHMLKLKRSIIHGLSAFLVMSYSECTRVSLYILAVGTVYTGSGKRNYVVFYNGDYPYLGNEHMKYALPAIFFLTTLVLIPPLLLLTYPLCYKLFALLKIEESKFVRITCKIIPLEKLKPLFDSMQGAFKDQFRFFAGMYFLYRLLFLLPLVQAKRLDTIYLFISGQLVIMLFLHCICRPYKNPWHNFLDGFFFLLLSIINLSTLFNFQLWIFPRAEDFQKFFLLSSILQCILLFLPMVYLVVYTLYCTALKFKCVRSCIEKRQQREHENTDYFLYELDTRSEKI